MALMWQWASLCDFQKPVVVKSNSCEKSRCSHVVHYEDTKVLRALVSSPMNILLAWQINELNACYNPHSEQNLVNYRKTECLAHYQLSLCVLNSLNFQEPGMKYLLMLYKESKHKRTAFRGLDAEKKKRHTVVMVITLELNIGGKITTRL